LANDTAVIRQSYGQNYSKVWFRSGTDSQLVDLVLIND